MQDDPSKSSQPTSLADESTSGQQPETATTMTENPAMESSGAGTTANATPTKDDHSSHSSDSSSSEAATISASSSSTVDNADAQQQQQQQPSSEPLWSESAPPAKPTPPKDLPLNGNTEQAAQVAATVGDSGNEPSRVPTQSNGKPVPPLPEIAADWLQAPFKSLAVAGNGELDGNVDDSYYNKLPHWSQNVTHLASVATDGLIAGGSDYGQLPFFSETGDIILEIDDIQVAGFTSSDVEEILARSPKHSFRLVPSNCGLPVELREYLSRRFARGSVDHKLQEVIRENVYARTIPCTTRPPRAGELDQVDYKFLSVEAFSQMERAGLLLESGLYQGYHYGTPLPVSNLSNSKSNGSITDGADNVAGNGIGGSNSNINSSQLSLASKRKRNRSNLAAIDASSLPYGWERIADAHYGVYYIDHINKRTQYERPYECELCKGISGFGFTLIEIDKGLVVVKSLIQGGAAQASGVIASGDVLVSVAGVAVAGMQHSDIAHLFSNFNVGDRVKLTFARGYQLPIGFTDEDYDIITLKIVKGEQGFGFTISEGHNGQKVKKILDLERCCALRQGDILLSINGIDLTTLTHLDVVETLKQCQVDEPTEFMIKRKKQKYGSLTRPKSSPMPMEEGESSSAVLQPMDTNVLERGAAFRSFKNGPSAEIYQQYGKLGAGNYAEYVIDDGMGPPNGGQMGPAVYANGAVLANEYANSQYLAQYGSVGSLQNGANGGPIYGSHYSDYAYQAPANMKSQSAPQIAPKPSNLDSPSSEAIFGGTNNYDAIDYEYIQVTLSRNENGFGFRIIGGSEEGSNVAIGSIVIGGAAYKDGALKAGDEIISINDASVVGASHQEVVQLMSQTGPAVRIVIRRKKYLNAYDVTLYRHDYEGFGFVIISCGNCALIGRIIENSPAHRCQRLHIRDRIIAVNGADVTNLSHPEIVNKIKESGDTLNLRIIPGDCYTVELIRGPSGYGFSIRGGAEYNGMPLFILAIAPNGPAASLLSIGDEILEINDCSTNGLTHPEAVRLISQSGPSVKLRLRRNLTAGGMNDLFQNGTPTAFSPVNGIGRVATPTQLAAPPAMMHSPNGAVSMHMLSPSPTHHVPFVPKSGPNMQPHAAPSPSMMGTEYGMASMNY